MADSSFGGPLQSPFLMANPAGPHTQGPEASAPPPLIPPTLSGYSAHSYESSSYHYFQPSAYEPQIADPNRPLNAPFYFHNRFSQSHQFSSLPGYRAPNMYPSANAFHNDPNPAGSTPSSFGNNQLPGSPGLPDARGGMDLFPMMEPSIPGGTQAYPLPSYTHVPTPPMHGYGPYPGRRPGPVMPNPAPTQFGRFGGDAPQSVNHGRGPSRAMTAGSSDQPRQLASPHRRPSYERQHQHTLQVPGGPDRRSQPLLGAHGRRSDRSVSPRTSHRRSFDRYSYDLPSSSMSRPEEATQRARMRRRLREHAIAHRQYPLHVDGNIPTPHQMKDLKNKLRHLLPSELPEGSSTCCDICQKDYSTKHCDATEENEVAIQLPCKHIFGEHCINTWFETCKTHKNKITCPMCRTLLVDPLRSSAPFSRPVPELLFFSHALERAGDDVSQAERQALAQLMEVRGLQGDF